MEAWSWEHHGCEPRSWERPGVSLCPEPGLNALLWPRPRPRVRGWALPLVPCGPPAMCRDPGPGWRPNPPPACSLAAAPALPRRRFHPSGRKPRARSFYNVLEGCCCRKHLAEVQGT